MKNHKKLRNALATLLLALPLALQGAVGVKTAQAAETSTETATVTLHKYVFDKSLPSDKIDNSKSQDEINAWLTKNNAEALDGVEFTAYDVTSEYADAYKTATGNNNESPADAAKTASAAVAKKADALQKTAKVVGKQTTANGGLASFANLPLRDANENYKAYLFAETDAPANITQKAEPFVLAMPIYGADGKTVQKSINIYPKNVKQSDKKTLNDNRSHHDFTAGEKINYTIETVVPWNIANKKVYTITDNPSKGLIMDADTIQIEGLASNKYTVKKNADNGFTITITAANLAAFAGKTLKTTVKGHLSIEDLTLIDTGIPNKATAKVDNEAHHEVKSEEVFTGGKKFVKVDGSNQSKTLAGAQFQLVIVKNGQVVKYAHGNEKDGYTFDTNNTNVATKTTGENGQFEFAGLKYSESLEAGESYAVKEVKAPTGYDLLKDPVLFTVAKDSYKTVQAADGQKISNTKKGGFLPSTGGMGIVLFIVAGVVVMAGAAGAMIARRNRRENI